MIKNRIQDIFFLISGLMWTYIHKFPILAWSTYYLLYLKGFKKKIAVF